MTEVNGGDQNDTPALTLEERVQHLEEAVHAIGTHAGTSHPTFTSFAQRIGARLKAAAEAVKKSLDASPG